MKAVYLLPKSSFVTELRSDTLWGLLMVAIRYVFSERKLLELLERFENGFPPFIISSAMPFLFSDSSKQNVIAHYFPKSIYQTADKTSSDIKKLEKRKKYKKLKYFVSEDFESLINGEADENGLIKKYFSNTEEDNSSLPSTSASTRVNNRPDTEGDSTSLPRQPQINSVSILHNTIDPLKGSTLELPTGGQLYYSKEYFIQNGGLFFLIDGDDISWVEPALRFLTHFGFGGDHSTGKGAVEFEIKDFNLRIPDNPDCFITLSLFNPKPEELTFFKENPNKFWYELVQRRGIVAAQFKKNSYRKKSFFAFAEGSVFPIIENHRYYGRILKTMEYPPAYSYCYAFVVPASFKEASDGN